MLSFAEILAKISAPAFLPLVSKTAPGPNSSRSYGPDAFFFLAAVDRLRGERAFFLHPTISSYIASSSRTRFLLTPSSAADLFNCGVRGGYDHFAAH